MRLTLASKASLLTVFFGFFLILFLMILMSVGVLIGLGGVFLTLGRKLPVSESFDNVKNSGSTHFWL